MINITLGYCMKTLDSRMEQEGEHTADIATLRLQPKRSSSKDDGGYHGNMSYGSVERMYYDDKSANLFTLGRAAVGVGSVTR